MNKFAEKLIDEIVSQKISQSEIARKLNISSQAVNRWCTGKREPDFDTLILLCLVLDTDPNYLLGFDEIEQNGLK